MSFERYVNPAETSYRAWCRDCNTFVSDSWDPFAAELDAREHEAKQYRKHYIVMYTDNVHSGFTGLEGN
jgi:hypothetical protein